MIPKTIHYCWFGEKNFSDLELRCMASWKEVMPEYQIKLWGESTIDLEKFPFAKEALKYGKYAFVSDVVRLHALYEEGGIYLDTDVLVLRSFDDLLANSFFTGEYKSGALGAAVIGAEQGDSLVGEMLKYYKNCEFDIDKLLTIPEVFDRFVWGFQGGFYKIYPPEFFYSFPFEEWEKDYAPFISEKSYCVHLWKHSWKDEFMLLKEFKFWESFLMNLHHIITSPSLYLTFSHQSRYLKDFYRRIKIYGYHQYYGAKEN